jgi:hypothetical protein
MWEFSEFSWEGPVSITELFFQDIRTNSILILDSSQDFVLVKDYVFVAVQMDLELYQCGFPTHQFC